jgi:hypothetical protein
VCLDPSLFFENQRRMAVGISQIGELLSKHG